jgi:hypothetical protein
MLLEFTPQISVLDNNHSFYFPRHMPAREYDQKRFHALSNPSSRLFISSLGMSGAVR